MLQIVQQTIVLDLQSEEVCVCVIEGGPVKNLSLHPRNFADIALFRTSLSHFELVGYFSRSFVTRLELANVAIRLASLSNQTVHINHFCSIQKVFQTNFPNGHATKQSYCGEANTCLPVFLPVFKAVQTHGNIHRSLSKIET